MIKKYFKKITAIPIACLILFVNSLNVLAAKGEIQTHLLVNNFEGIEIQDVELLIQRAELGIDEFKENTGMNFQIDNEIMDMNLPATTVELCSEREYNLKTYQTSQYLGKIVNEQGRLDDVYAIHGISVYSDTTVSDTDTNGGCTITTTLYIQWGTGDRIELKLLRSSANLSGTLRPTSLKMENCVYEGWTTNVNHYNTKTISLPSAGIYNLYPSYTGYISEYSSYVGAEDTVSFGDGGVLKTSIYYDC